MLVKIYENNNNNNNKKRNYKTTAKFHLNNNNMNTMNLLLGSCRLLILLFVTSYLIEYSDCSMNLRGFEDTLNENGYEYDYEYVEPRIINGQNAELGRYPYFVLLDHSSRCGGVLIAPDIVLTAASCVDSNTFGPVARIGIQDSYSYEGRSNADTIYIERRISHPNFVSYPLVENDIAILKLERPSIFPYAHINNPYYYGSTVTSSSTSILPINGQELTIIGMGDTGNNGNNNNNRNILQETQVDYVNNTKCQEIYNDSILSLLLLSSTNSEDNSDNNSIDNNSDNSNIILEEHLCAHRIGTDACYGDSGSPIFIKSSQQQQQQQGQQQQQQYNDLVVGIVSWGDGCATQFPGVNSRISYFSNWIVRVACTVSDETNSETWPFDCSHIEDTESPTSSPTSFPTYDDFKTYNTTLIHWTPQGNNIILDRCQADCDLDIHCKGNLICWDWPNINDEVPGCIGIREQNGNADYCVRPKDIPHRR